MADKVSKKVLAKRYAVFIIGLFLEGVAVAFTRHSELGVSPISSVANVMSYQFSFLSLGTWLMIWNVCLIVGQVIVLGKNFQLFQLLQIPLSVLFGWFTDLGMKMVADIPVPNYVVKLLFLFIGIVILALGIELAVIANVILNSGEAFVKAIADTSGKAFGDVKVIFDVCCVGAAVVLSLIFFHGRIVGTREGTIITALVTGYAVKWMAKLIQEPIEKMLRD